MRNIKAGINRFNFLLNPYVDKSIFQYSFDFLAESNWLNQVSELPDFLRTAIRSRQLEFLAGRYCANKVIANLIKEETAENRSELFDEKWVVIPVGNKREPIWTEEIVGSITHKDELAWSVVGKRENYYGIGIDLENVALEKTTERLKGKILTKNDLVSSEKNINNCTLTKEENFSIIFSIKESFYKFAYPIIGQYIGFHEVDVLFSSFEKGDLSVRGKITIIISDRIKKLLLASDDFKSIDSCCGNFFLDKKEKRVYTSVILNR